MDSKLYRHKYMPLMIQADRKTVVFVDKHRAAEVTGLSAETLKTYRLDGRLIEGIHWVSFNSRCVRFNLELLENWVKTRGCPEQHQKAIDAHVAALSDNDGSKKSGRPRKNSAANVA